MRRTFVPHRSAVLMHFNSKERKEGLMLRNLTIMSFLGIILALSGCGGGPASTPPPPQPMPSSPFVSIMPTSDTLGPNGQRQFLATVSLTNPGIDWTVGEGAAGGTISSNGLYTAPSKTGAFHVTATSVADSSQSATATVTVVPSGFTATGCMENTFGSPTLLANGKVLVVGLADGSGVSAELFDPVTDSFTPTSGSMIHPRSGPYAVLLDSGKVLLAGGSDSNGLTVTSSELFDPSTGGFAS